MEEKGCSSITKWKRSKNFLISKNFSFKSGNKKIRIDPVVLQMGIVLSEFKRALSGCICYWETSKKSVVFLSFLSSLTVMQLSVGYVISNKMP